MGGPGFIAIPGPFSCLGCQVGALNVLVHVVSCWGMWGCDDNRTTTATPTPDAPAPRRATGRPPPASKRDRPTAARPAAEGGDGRAALRTHYLSIIRSR